MLLALRKISPVGKRAAAGLGEAVGAEEIAEDLRSALEEFETIQGDLAAPLEP